MKRKLYATIEEPNGNTYEQCIAIKDNGEPFTKEEMEKAVQQQLKMLGEEYRVCEPYEW